MKKPIAILFLINLIAIPVLGQYSAMTYNIRFSTQNDGENWWELRKEWVADLVNYYEPDVLGIQEGLYHQVAYLDSALNGYSYVGVGRDDGKQAGEFSAIYYKDYEYEVIDSGTFWLSETPDQVSVGWDASMERISTWALFKDIATANEFYVFNAHLDHRGATSRLNALKLIHEKAEEFNSEKLPVILMGDLNAVPESEPIQFLNKVMFDSKIVSGKKPFGPEGTFNGFDTSHPLDYRIDYIFVDETIEVLDYAVLSNSQQNRTPSDHLPVYINFMLRK